MKLAGAKEIRALDAYARDVLGIPTEDLIVRSGTAVARVVREKLPVGARVCVMVGKGNNGADGCAAASALLPDYDVCVVDVFGKNAGNVNKSRFLDVFLEKGGRIVSLSDALKTPGFFDLDAMIDAVFGTGFSGALTGVLGELAAAMCASSALKIAVDLPLGVSSDDATVADGAVMTDMTVALSALKPAHLCYPARAFCGEVILDPIGLSEHDFDHAATPCAYAVDPSLAATLLPLRGDNSHKGTFGKALVITGSSRYPGAAHLSLEAALRGGAGLVTYLGEGELVRELTSKYPEALYRTRPLFESMKNEDVDALLALDASASATLIGSGCCCSSSLAEIVYRLLAKTGGTLVLDADALNSLALDRDRTREAFRAANRPVILTPHPTEFARLSGLDTGAVQNARLPLARAFAEENGVTLVLKGAGTVVTDGNRTFINTTGSSALAKGGSGDVLAGLIASLSAMGGNPTEVAALAAYLHGAAADTLSAELSEFSVTPSDLPRAIGREIIRLSKL